MTMPLRLTRHRETELNSVPPLLARMKQYGIMLFLYFAGVTAFAEAGLRNSFDAADMQLMATTNLTYTSCLQENARQLLASSPDVRVIAGHATEACAAVLTELQTTLTDREINPDFYMGAVTRMKSRAIRRLLPLLMMEKSNQGG